MPLTSIATASEPVGPAERVAGSRAVFATGALAVLIAYSLPLVLGWARTGHVPNLLFSDETIYAVRVLEVYRGGNLASPYFAGHDDAPRYMPELAERALAGAARVTHVPPLIVLALSRVVIPLLIFAVLWELALALDLSPPLALLAAILPVLGLSSRGDGPHFLRYMRLISPASYALLLVIALYAWLLAWKKPGAKTALFAGAAGGALFYAAPYYWSFAAAGAVVLAMVSRRSRRWIFAGLAVAVVIGAPALWNSLVLSRVPVVQQTIHRFALMTPGRDPDLFVLPRFLVATLFSVVLWTQRRRVGPRATFLLAFFVPGTLLLVQNVITNRHAQSYHWVECLIPTGALALAAMLDGIRLARPSLLYAAAALIAAAGIASHAGAYRHWEATAQRDPLDWRLNLRIPATLAWLNANTPPQSVLLVRDYHDRFPMYTRNKLYDSYYAAQYVVGDDELRQRQETAATFDPTHPVALPYRADYYVGFGDSCATPALPVSYRNAAEGTCVLDLRSVK